MTKILSLLTALAKSIPTFLKLAEYAKDKYEAYREYRKRKKAAKAAYKKQLDRMKKDAKDGNRPRREGDIFDD